MQIQIVNKNIDVSPAIKERIEDRLEDMMDKYIHRDGDAHVAISREGKGFRVICDVNLPSGVSIQGQGEDGDAYGAADEALEHTEKRLRRYKRRLKDHHADTKAEAMAMFILESPNENADKGEEEPKDGPFEPMVIAERNATVRTMTPAMASLELSLSDTGAIVFRNAAHGGVNVVFTRADGNVGWIDPDR